MNSAGGCYLLEVGPVLEGWIGKDAVFPGRGWPRKIGDADPKPSRIMKGPNRVTVVSLIALALGGALVSPVHAEDDGPIAVFMKECHKAPKGVDPVCKKATLGTATPEEIKKLIAGYKIMAKEKAPKGDAASWKEKTERLVKASEALVKGGDEARNEYKEAVNCKACHSQHRPD